MATSVEELVDMLFNMIDEARNAPLTPGKCLLERDKALDLVEDIRAQLPVELAEANKIVNARAEHIAAAKREAEDIRRRAEAEARQRLENDEIMNAARQKASELMRKAEEDVKKLKRSANEYCEDLLRRTEEALGEALTEARRARTSFRSAANMGKPDPSPSAKNSRVFDVEAQG